MINMSLMYDNILLFRHQFIKSLDIIKEEKDKMFGTSISHVRVKKMNLDLACTMDLINGTGIRLQSTDSFHQKTDKLTKKTEKVWDGLQSDFFG